MSADDEVLARLVRIETLLTTFVNRSDDHESRIRDLYNQLAERPSKDDLRSQRNLIITVVTVVVLVVGGIVGLVAALVGGA